MSLILQMEVLRKGSAKLLFRTGQLFAVSWWVDLTEKTDPNKAQEKETTIKKMN